MFLMDVNVNVLVYAHREDAANHPAYRQWLESVMGVIKSAVYIQGKRSVTVQREAQNPSPAGEAEKPRF